MKIKIDILKAEPELRKSVQNLLVPQEHKMHV
jgi:hypothetical protein